MGITKNYINITPTKQSTQNNMHVSYNFDKLVQERCNSSVLAMELYLSCTNLSTYLMYPNNVIIDAR